MYSTLLRSANPAAGRPDSAIDHRAVPSDATDDSGRRWRRRALTVLTVATLLGLLEPASLAEAAAMQGSVHQAMPLAVNDLPTIVTNLRNWVMGILAGLATLFLTIGGVRYVMAGGDPSEIERAKSAFRSAAVGYALALIAPVVLTVLNSVIGK